MTRIILSAIFGAIFATTLFIWAQNVNKLPEPFYFIFALSAFAGSLISGNIHQPNEFGGGLFLFVFFSLCCYLNLMLLIKLFRFVKRNI